MVGFDYGNEIDSNIELGYFNVLLRLRSIVSVCES